MCIARKFSSNVFIGFKNNGLSVLPISSKNAVCTTFHHCIATRYYNTKVVENIANNEEKEKLKVEDVANKEEIEKLMEENTANEEKNNEDLTKEDDIQEQLNAFIKSDPDNARRYKLLQLEIELMRQNGEKVPSRIKPYQWTPFFELKSNRQRQRYLLYLWKGEMKNLSKQKKKLEKQKALESASLDTEGQQYSLGKNSFFMRIYDSTMNYGNHSRLISAMLYGQKLVFDCGYDDYMSAHELSSCAKQLLFVFANNREHIDPFDLYFCNLPQSSRLMQYLIRSIPTVNQPEFPLNITPKSYLDLFDKDRLVYLTPHCQNEMDHYDMNAVYIVGALVDKENHNPLSLAKAKREGLKMAKLPLSKHLKWGPGSGKNLNINHVFDILLTKRHTGDWAEALKHVPVRKLAPYREQQLQNKIKQGFIKSQDMNMQIQTNPYSTEPNNYPRKK